VRELSVDMFTTVDGYGGPGPRSAPYWGYGGPGLFEWMHAQLAEKHVMLMVETAVPALKAMPDGLPMRTIGSMSLVRSLFRLGLVDRVRVMIFPMIHGAAGEGPVFADLPDLDLSLKGTTVIDDRVVLLDYQLGGE
jgi:dihydrofolate reductase